MPHTILRIDRSPLAKRSVSSKSTSKVFAELKAKEAVRPKIGLALGSGGARGLAHIGAIKVLEEHGIPIDLIAGTSIGAMIGGLYAAGLSVREIEEIALSSDWRTVLNVFLEPPLKQGLIKGDKTKAFIEKYLGDKIFDDCRIPFAAVATNLKTGDIVVLDKGRLVPAIRASVSIPLVYCPVEIAGNVLADGALSAPVPVQIVRNMGAELVIAVNLGKHHYDETRKPGLYDIANDSLSIMQHHLALRDTASADVVIDVNVTAESWYDFANARSKIQAGEEAARGLMPRIREKISEKSKGSPKEYLKSFEENIRTDLLRQFAEKGVRLLAPGIYMSHLAKSLQAGETTQESTDSAAKGAT